MFRAPEKYFSDKFRNGNLILLASSSSVIISEHDCAIVMRVSLHEALEALNLKNCTGLVLL